MKTNRQSSVRTFRGKKGGLASSSGVEGMAVDRETHGGNSGRLSPSNLGGHGNNSKVIHKGFFNSFQGMWLLFSSLPFR